jgi:hypothetical protein
MSEARVRTTQSGVVDALGVSASESREVMPVFRVYTPRPELEDALTDLLYLILFGEPGSPDQRTSEALTPTCFSSPPK